MDGLDQQILRDTIKVYNEEKDIDNNWNSLLCVY
jgi:hypothetical protein